MPFASRDGVRLYWKLEDSARRRGELLTAANDRGWPREVVLPARLCERGGYNEIHEFRRDWRDQPK